MITPILDPDRTPLPKRLAEPCDYCGRKDCVARFDHQRWQAGNEETYWRRSRS